MESDKNAATRGQRRGFYWQDWYAAWTMLRALVSPVDGIEAVEVEAKDALHVDDVVIYHKDRTVYRQLKHKVGESPRFVGSDLFGEYSGQPSLIRKLYLGWQGVKSKSERPVEVRLTTNATPSSDPKNQPVSPAAFDARILSALRRGSWSPSQSDAELLDKIQTLAGAPDSKSLCDFLTDLHLDCGCPSDALLKREVENLLITYLRAASHVSQEAEAWVAVVYDLSTQYGENEPMTRGRIESELRRLLRYSRRPEHRLALPRNHLVRPVICDDLLARARGMSSGYLLVTGPPGCGKTTLATWLADTHDDEIVARYHAFDPRQASLLERKGRASAIEFVSTIFDVLSERFPEKSPCRALSQDRLPEAVGILREQLAALATKNRRLVIVDGIDHVVRAGISESSLFEALPNPPPDGIVFILFGQPDWDYPKWIDRSVRWCIPAFSDQETREYLCGALEWSGADKRVRSVCSAIYAKTSGNPLSLVYTLRAIDKLGGGIEQVIDNFSEVARFGKCPHDEYERLLDDLEAQLVPPQGSLSLLKDMLACVAVASAAITEDRLSRAFKEDGLSRRQARDFLVGLGPVLSEKGRGRFFIFHDDFRRYAEDCMSAEERVSAHGRVARSLGEDWAGDEACSVAEHLWEGAEHETLADFPTSWSLEKWFTHVEPQLVVSVHRLALAGALQIADEIRIMRSALGLENVLEAADLTWSPSGPPVDRGLAPWLSIVPPVGVDRRMLERRALALRVAGKNFSSEEETAKEVAARFMVSPSLIRVKEEFGAERLALSRYIEALACWMLNSGSLVELNRLIENDEYRAAAIAGVASEFSALRRVDLAGRWVALLSKTDVGLCTSLEKVALEHLLAGRAPLARQISDALLRCPDVPASVRRAATVLTCLIDGNIRRDGEVGRLSVSWGGDEYQPISWRHFFFAGFCETAVGPVLDLGAAELPSDLASKCKMIDASAETARTMWNAGAACGLVMRNGDLLPEREMTNLLDVLVPASIEHCSGRDRARFRCAGFLLPLLALAVRGSVEASTTMRHYLARFRDEPTRLPMQCRYGYLEALWYLDPDAWREVARGAHARGGLPGTDSYERIEWFRYWSENEQRWEGGGVRCVRGQVYSARLGVGRKEYPADAAVSILCSDVAASDLNERIQKVLELLSRVYGEPEGRVALYLPRILALSLEVSAFEFYKKFISCTCGEGFADAFGVLPAEVAECILGSKAQLSAGELVAIWYWVVAAPGTYGSIGLLERIRGRIVDGLLGLGCKEDALIIQAWHAHRSSASGLGQDKGASESPSKDTGGAAAPDIEGVTFRWFSSWWSSDDHRALRTFLNTEADAWGRVCRILAHKTARSEDVRAYDCLAIGENLHKVRPGIDTTAALHVAMDYVSQKVRYQPCRLPSIGGGEGVSDLSDAVVALVCRGLEVGDAETVRLSLRSLSYLGRHGGTREAVLRELSGRLSSRDVLLVRSALSVIRRVGTAGNVDVVALIRPLVEHPDAWCRYLACKIVGEEPSWPEVRGVGGIINVVVPEIQPDARSVGAAYYSEVSSVREVMIRKIRSVLAVDDDLLRSWYDAEFRTLCKRKDRWLGWGRQLGPRISNGHAFEAAGRLVCRLASSVPAELVPVILSVAASFDPWLIAQPPVTMPHEGWVELCRTELRHTESGGEYLLRALGNVSQEALTSAGEGDRRLLADALSHFLAPLSSEQYCWVAEDWPGFTALTREEGPIMSMARANSILGVCTRCQFNLIPSPSHPFIQELKFDLADQPAWFHPEMGQVILPAFGESVASHSQGGRHAAMDWWTAWYALPEWLESLQATTEETRLVQFWRIAKEVEPGALNSVSHVECDFEVIV